MTTRARIVTPSARILTGVVLVVAVEFSATAVDALATRAAAWTTAGVVGVVGVFRLLALGLYLGPAGVRVVNVLREYEVPWSQVRAVRWKDGVGVMAGVPGQPARLDTTSGTRTITATWAFYPAEKERMLDVLRPFTTPRGVVVEPGRVAGDRPPPPPHAGA